VSCRPCRVGREWRVGRGDGLTPFVTADLAGQRRTPPPRAHGASRRLVPAARKSAGLDRDDVARYELLGRIGGARRRGRPRALMIIIFWRAGRPMRTCPPRRRPSRREQSRKRADEAGGRSCLSGFRGCRSRRREEHRHRVAGTEEEGPQRGSVALGELVRTVDADAPPLGSDEAADRVKSRLCARSRAPTHTSERGSFRGHGHTRLPPVR